ncbi:glycosyltransferase [Lithospermum erythrorhizon]|uniref:Glycosyltransferase n=1 Tax=Lithospermum erythrorhizon TaxID=34254 RepID=A0AAV3RB32_LITER
METSINYFKSHLEGQTNGTIRVLMLSWLAHGHIFPFLELAKRLVNTNNFNFIVYFCSTPIILNSIKKKLKGGKFSSLIKFVELHLQESSDLPPSHHTTNGLPPNLMGKLKKAFKSSLPNFTNILEDLKPDLFLYDSAEWAANVAREYHIPSINFITTSTTMTCFLFHAFKNLKGNICDDFPFIETIHFRSYEKHRLDNLIARVENQHVQKESTIECIEKSSGIVLIKGIKDNESKYCDYLSKLCGKKIILVGPLVQEPADEDDDENSDEIISWLNKKSEKSTILISFGSEYFLSNEETEAIGHGLELTNVNFIWVVRFPKGKDISIVENFLQGFLARVGDRGLVVDYWAPQARILKHPSIGGFLSHCGWSSVMESMKYGIPLITLPMQIDQPINSRLVEEVGIGIEVVRSDDRKIDKEKVARVINKVVNEEGGRFVREKIKNVSDKIALKGNDEMNVVVEELVKLYYQKKKKINK